MELVAGMFLVGAAAVAVIVAVSAVVLAKRADRLVAEYEAIRAEQEWDERTAGGR